MEVLGARRDAGPRPIASTGLKLFALQTDAVRGGADALIIDTPAVLEDEVIHSVALSNLAILVVRPTFLDLTAVVRTSNIIRQLKKPGLVLLNQAPVAREAVEPPAVKRAIEALHLLKLPVVPVVVRSRTAYQTVLETGCSAEELASEPVAAREMGELCAFIDRFTFGGHPARN